MSADIVAFLRARYDEDERRARAATPGPWDGASGATETDSPGSGVYVYMDGIVADLPAARMPNHAADARHIARHDPARVLREVEAKRRRLDRHQPVSRPAHVDLPSFGDEGLGDLRQFCVRDEDPWPCADVRDEAAPYADHPDYDPAWAVTPS